MSISPIPKKNPAPTQPEVPAPAKAVKKSGFGFLLIFFIALIALGALLYFFGIAPRFAQNSDLDREQKINSQRLVVFGVARLAAPKIELPLPGTVQAFQQASIYARTSGYVKKWNADIGDVVHEGEPLAEIDTPEVDQQLAQAKATAEQAKAAVAIAQLAADRWDAMVKARAVSQQEADEKDSALAQAKATFDADIANVGQLTAQENFKHIVAPFTGTITYRNIEVGNLVTAPTGSNANTSGTTEIYRIAQTDPLRVYVDVPESATRAISPGVEADLHVAQYPDRVFHGEVARSAGALDAVSRTLKTEIRVANPDGALLPGAFAEVRLNLVDGAPAILIPANTLIVNSSGTQVALIESLDGQDKVHFLPVKVGRDFGTEVEILQDVKDGDRLVTNPPADLSEGAVVVAKPLPKPPKPPVPSPAVKS
jgi:membrane fusion protein (multidrug efflux system)